jgi:hypothetical protein
MEAVSNFILEKKIDSFQKLRLVLYLAQHPGMAGTSEQLGQQLFIRDSRLMEEIIHGLRTAGLVDFIGQRYVLRDDPAVNSALQRLNRLYDDPVSRQRLLDYVRGPSLTRRMAGW